MIEGKTKSGISFTIREGIGDDMRIVKYIVEMEGAKEPLEQFKAVSKLLDLIFGESAMIFMDAVAEAHDGICTAGLLIAELKEIFEAAKLKN